MNALIKIYEGPVYLIGKVNRDHCSLVNALRNNNLAATKDAVFNFAVSAYHIVEWIKQYNPELRSKAKALQENGSMKIIRDICNATKHVELDENSKPNKDNPPITGSVEQSFTSSVSLPDVNRWTLKIVMKDGDRKRFEDIANTIIADLEQFFRENGIHSDNTVETTNSCSLD